MKRVVGLMRAYAAFGQTSSLVITTASPLPGAFIWRAYSLQFAASGGVPPYTWSLTAGNLQEGLSLSGGGLLSGTVTSTEAETFSVQVMDSVGATQVSTFSLSVLFNYYIATGGNDANLGTLASPWAITSLRNDSANWSSIANKSVGLLNGVYNVAAYGKQTNPLTIQGGVRLIVPNGSPGTPTVVCAVNQRQASITAKTAGIFGTNNFNTDGHISIIGFYDDTVAPTYPHDFVIQDLVIGGNLNDIVEVHNFSNTPGSGIVIRNCEICDATNWTGGSHNMGGLHIEGLVSGTLVQNCSIHDCYDVKGTPLTQGNSCCIYDYSQNTIIEYCKLWNAAQANYQKIGRTDNPPQGETFRYNYIYTNGASSQWHYDGGDPSFEFNNNINGANNLGIWAGGTGPVPNPIPASANFANNSFVNAPWSKETCQMDVTFYFIAGGSEVHVCTFTHSSPTISWNDYPVSQPCTDNFTAVTHASAHNNQGGMSAALSGGNEAPGTSPPYTPRNIYNNVFEDVPVWGDTNPNQNYVPSTFVTTISKSFPSGSTTGPQIGDTNGTLTANYPFITANPMTNFNHVGGGTETRAVTFTHGSNAISWGAGLTVACTNNILIWNLGAGLQADNNFYNNTIYVSDRTLMNPSAVLAGLLIPLDPSLTTVRFYNNIIDTGNTLYANSSAGMLALWGGNWNALQGPTPPTGVGGWTIVDFNNWNVAWGSTYSSIVVNYAQTDFYPVAAGGHGAAVRFTSLANWQSLSSTWGPSADANSNAATPTYLAGPAGTPGTPVRAAGSAQYKLQPGSAGTTGSSDHGSTTGLVGGSACDKGAWGGATPPARGIIGSNF